MKSLSLYKAIQYKLLLSRPKGFTLIELLVVVIIVGILSAISIPNLIANIGKARETEATSNLGILSRSQQAYHFETQEFADTIEALTANVSLNTEHYNFPDPTIANDNLAKHQAVPLNVGINQMRKYAVGIYHNSGDFSTIICQGKVINAAVEAPDNSSGSCSNGGRKLQ